MTESDGNPVWVDDVDGSLSSNKFCKNAFSSSTETGNHEIMLGNFKFQLKYTFFGLKFLLIAFVLKFSFY